jgi:hypothetical protein
MKSGLLDVYLFPMKIIEGIVLLQIKIKRTVTSSYYNQASITRIILTWSGQRIILQEHLGLPDCVAIFYL